MLMLDWVSNSDTSWWADLCTLSGKKSVSSRGIRGERFEQRDSQAVTRGILLRKILQAARDGDVVRRDETDYVIKSRNEWAKLCRLNYSTIERRLEDLRYKLRFISITHQPDAGARRHVLAIKINWDLINKKARELDNKAA